MNCFSERQFNLLHIQRVGNVRHGQNDQVAPMLVAASMAMMVCGMLGMNPATRSPAVPPLPSAWTVPDVPDARPRRKAMSKIISRFADITLEDEGSALIAKAQQVL